MATTNTTTSNVNTTANNVNTIDKKQAVKDNQAKLTGANEIFKNYSKDLSGIRTIILAGWNDAEIKKQLLDKSLTQWQVNLLVKSKKDTAIFNTIKESVQWTPNNTTCVYWVLRTLRKLENKANQA